MQVVAALIEHEGKLLVCQRRRGGPFELLWEFPGGKVQPGEALEAALARELEEELGVTANVGREVYRTEHRYPEMKQPLKLVFFAASVQLGQIQNREFERIEWRRPEELPGLDFLQADRDLVAKLASGAIRAGWRD